MAASDGHLALSANLDTPLRRVDRLPRIHLPLPPTVSPRLRLRLLSLLPPSSAPGCIPKDSIMGVHGHPWHLVD